MEGGTSAGRFLGGSCSKNESDVQVLTGGDVGWRGVAMSGWWLEEIEEGARTFSQSFMAAHKSRKSKRRIQIETELTVTKENGNTI